MQGSRRQIMEYLREHDSAAVEFLAAAVDLAPVTVRHHLKVLRQRGLVEVQSERVGRGRPRHVYRLSPSGSASLCENRYEQLAERMLDLVKHGDGQVAERFFSDMAKGIVADHRAALSLARGPAESLDLVVDILGAEGFTARWNQDGDAYLLHATSCPYASLGERHAEVCCMDMALIGAAMDAEVVRESWRMDGDEACVYRVRPRG
jgi:predicted ArsR family transcriptional regulator